MTKLYAGVEENVNPGMYILLHNDSKIRPFYVVSRPAKLCHLKGG